MGKAVKSALMGNFSIGVIKSIGAFFTGSASMTAEAVHSFADSGNQILLLWGEKRAKKKANDDHPFGFGKEEYFWSFIVAIVLFVLGSVYSIYEGVHKLQHPQPLSFISINLCILIAGMIIEGWAWSVARKEMDCDNSELFQEVIDSKDASTIVVLVEDTGALIGLGLAFIGNVLSWVTGDPMWDAISSCIIGVLLAVTAYFLANEMRKLMIGEAIDEVEIRYIRRVLNASKNVKKVGVIRTEQKGNKTCVVCVDVDFRDDLTDVELGGVIRRLTKKIQRTLPKAKYIYLQPKQM